MLLNLHQDQERSFERHGRSDKFLFGSLINRIDRFPYSDIDFPTFVIQGLTELLKRIYD
jgi:hypothetical protein